MSSHCQDIDLQLQTGRQYRNGFSQCFYLHYCRWLASKISIPAAAGLRLGSAAQRDADTARITVSGMLLHFCKCFASQIHLTAGADVQVIIIINIFVVTCRPVQIKPADPALSLHGQSSQLTVCNSLRIDNDHFFTTFQPCSRSRCKKTEPCQSSRPQFRFQVPSLTKGVTILFLLSLFLVFLSPSFLALLKTSFDLGFILLYNTLFIPLLSFDFVGICFIKINII